MKRLVSLLLSCLLLSSCGTIVTPAKTPPEHLVSEAPPAQVLPAPGEMPELLPDSQEAGGENASEPSPEEGGGTPVETLPEPQRVVEPTRPMVALTFDDGPHAVYTDQILDYSGGAGAVATFFEVARISQGAGGSPPGGGHGLRDRQPLYRHANLGRWIRPPSRRIRPRRTRCFGRCWGPRPRCCGRPMAP
ncbi:MAG: polysaccharide deacetylase family protein [Dysosmobacter welbionis]